MQDNDKYWFDEELRLVLASSAKWFHPKKENIATYWTDVAHYTRAETETGLGLIRTRFKNHFTPADLREATEEAHKINVRKVQERRATMGTVDVPDIRGPDFDDMVHVAAPAFAQRVIRGKLPQGIKWDARYSGDFHWEFIVSVAEIPERFNRQSPTEHTQVWKEFFTLLRYEWDHRNAANTVQETRTAPREA